MKTAIYIENGVTQLVLTPESPWENKVVESIAVGDKNVKLLRGSFYECRGGWYRQNASDESLIIRMDVAPEPADQ
jgi:hypothetical protein